MASTPSTIDLTSREASAGPSELPSTLLDAFSQMIQPVKNEVRDRCRRPSLTYNSNYNPYKPPRDDLPLSYSPYVFREPLYDD
jgi:hypothetical protein